MEKEIIKAIRIESKIPLVSDVGYKSLIKFVKKLFEEEDEHWTKEWQDMPEFVQEDLTSFRKIVVHFKNNDAVDKFSKLIGQKITPKQPSLWYPEVEPRRYANKKYIDES